MHERTGYLSFYHELIWYDLETGGGHPLPAVREKISRETLLGGDDLGDLQEHDECFLGHVLSALDEDIWPGLLEPHPEQPMEKWWWHLGAIRRRTYPVELLPEYLREIYEKTE